MTHHQSMTSAEFSARYQLIKPVADGKVRTLNALAVASGKVVMVHYLVGSTDENNAVLARVRALPDIERLKVVETLDVEGHPVVVTQFLQGFESLDVWMSSHTPGGASAGAGAAKQIKVTMRRPDAPQPRLGSTQPIRAGGGGAGKVAPPPPPPPVAPPPAAASATGSMTQPMAATPKAPPAPPPAAPALPPPPPPPPAPPRPAAPPASVSPPIAAPVEKPAPPTPVAPPPPPPPAAPGEFTRIFQMGGLSTGPDRSAPSGPLYAPPVPGVAPASQRPAMPTPPSAAPSSPFMPMPSVMPPAPPAPGAASATGMMSAPKARTPEPAPVVVPRVAPPPPIPAAPLIPEPRFGAV